MCASRSNHQRRSARFLVQYDYRRFFVHAVWLKSVKLISFSVVGAAVTERHRVYEHWLHTSMYLSFRCVQLWNGVFSSVQRIFWGSKAAGRACTLIMMP